MTNDCWCLQHCVALADVTEDFAGAAEHKHPKIRLDSLKLLQVGLHLLSCP